MSGNLFYSLNQGGTIAVYQTFESLGFNGDNNPTGGIYPDGLLTPWLDLKYNLAISNGDLIGATDIKITRYKGMSDVVKDSIATVASDGVGVAWRGGNLYSLDEVTAKVYKHSGFSTTITDSFSMPGSEPKDIAFDNGGNMISCDKTTDKIYLHSGFSSTILDSFSASNRVGVTWDGSNIVSCTSGGQRSVMYKHSGFSPTISASFFFGLAIAGNAETHGIAWADPATNRVDVAKTIDITESVDFFGLPLSLEIDEDIIALDVVSNIGHVYFVDVHDSVSIIEDVDLLVGALNIFSLEDIAIQESVNIVDLIVELSVYEDVSITEWNMMALEVIDLLIFEDIIVADVPIINLPYGIQAIEYISVEELISMNDIIVEMPLVYETMTVSESVTIGAPFDDFASFLRKLPFTEISHIRVDTVEYNGIRKSINRWGRDKKQFNINFAISNKSDAISARVYFDNYVGQVFRFKSPLDNVLYNVRFLTDSYRLERRHFDVYYASVSLLEVF